MFVSATISDEIDKLARRYMREPVEKLIEAGYPPRSILWYRGGMPDWVTLGAPGGVRAGRAQRRAARYAAEAVPGVRVGGHYGGSTFGMG